MPYRNLSLEDLARHIGMDARDVRRLAEKGVLPGQMVGGEWRFNRAHLLDWLQSSMHTFGAENLQNLERAMADEPDPLVLGQRLAPQAVEMHLAARSRPSVLRALVELAQRTGLVFDDAVLHAAVLDRENTGSTALPGGVALPHPRRPLHYATAEPLIAVGRVVGGVPFSAPDGRLTDIFVLICSHDDRAHLLTLARLGLMFGSTPLAEELRELDDNESALLLLLQRERELLARRN